VKHRTLSMVSLQANPQEMSGDVAEIGGQSWCHVLDTLRL